MRARELICYGCKGGDGEPLRIQAFTDLENCPKCKRPFHSARENDKPCSKCQAPTPGGGLCSSCGADRKL